MLYFPTEIKPPTELEASIIKDLKKFNKRLEDGLDKLSYLPLPRNTFGNIRRVGNLLWDVVNDANIYSDECNILVTTSMGNYWHRNPYCQPPPLPPPLDDEDYEKNVKIPEGEGVFFLYTVSSSYLEIQEYDDGTIGHYESKFHSSIENVALPYTGDVKCSASFNPSILVQPQWALQFSAGFSGNVNKAYYEHVTTAKVPDNWNFSDSNNKTFTLYADNGTKSISVGIPARVISHLDQPLTSVPASFRIFQNKSELLGYFQQHANEGTPIKNYRKTTRYEKGTIVKTEEVAFYGMPLLVDPPPPPPLKECDCMGCCPDVSGLDTLLKLVLKRIGDLPANVPDNFTKQNPTYVNIESLAELALWQMQQLDALMGAYPIKLEIEDTDLIQEGNQTQKLELPNQAEVLAEILGLIITIKRDTHATLVTAIKAMAEAGMTKNLATQTLDVTLGNAEFLGYKLEQVKRTIPSLFTPNGANLTETLKEKNIEIVSYENTDTKDLQDDLKMLKTMAARWNAQNWRQVTGDPVESLKQSLFGNPDAIKETHKENEQGDFNDFTEQAERGFIEVSGITDTVNPWGRPYAQRPKVREIGTEKGNYDNDGKEKVD